MNKSKFRIGTYLCSLVFIGIYLSIGAHSAYAAGPSVAIVKLPEYLNTTNFNLSYSAIAPAGLKNVTLAFHKEGDAWQTLSTFTTNSDQLNMQSHIGGEDNTYFFSATACDNSDLCNTDYTQTKLDRIAPPKPDHFYQDQPSSNVNRLHWTNGDSDDLYQVYIYRSDHLGFTADSGTQVGTVNVSKNTDSQWDNSVPTDGKTYYYLLRSVDRAGNASDVTGDLQVNTTTVVIQPTGTPVTGKESFSGQKLALAPAVLGAKTDITPVASPKPSAEAGTPTPETAITTQASDIAKAVQKTSPLWPIFGFTLFAVAIYWFVSKKK
jgi:hypothetical protein